jgi:hypothetical protein
MSNTLSATAMVAVAQVTPYTPNTGAQPFNGESIMAYPSDSQGKPLMTQPRSHSTLRREPAFGALAHFVEFDVEMVRQTAHLTAPHRHNNPGQQ